METVSGKFPAHVSRELLHRWIPILPLNVGDKRVAKIKCRRALSAEASGTCLRMAKRLSWNSARQNQVIGRKELEYQNPSSLLRSQKVRF